MRQKKKSDESKQGADTETAENCVKCSRLQNGCQSASLDETETQGKQTALGSLKSVLKRSASHKKPSKSQEKIIAKELLAARKQKNRVTFDETQNKYFDADYVILIHEEEYDYDDYYDEGSPYDDDDDEMYDESSMAGSNMCCRNPNCNNLIAVGGFTYPAYHPQGAYFSKDRQDYYYDDGGPVDSGKSKCGYDKCDGCGDVYDVEVVPDFSAGNDYGDHVTLSPPEGYKDGGCCPHHGLQFHPQPGASYFHEENGPPCEDDQEEENTAVARESEPNREGEVQSLEEEEEIKAEVKQRFIVETITMTTVTERRIVREAEDISLEGAKKSGILKGGKFWKSTTEKHPEKNVNYNEVVDYKENDQEPEFEEVSTSFTLEEEGNGNESKLDIEENGREEVEGAETEDASVEGEKNEKDETVSPESTELMLTFKLGQHVLVANSLKPNSAVRQLFPTSRLLSPPPQDDDDVTDNEKSCPPKQFLVTAESLRLFEEAKKSKILGNINEKESGQSIITIMPPTDKTEDDDYRIRKTIERNTLRRSLIRYPCDLRSKRYAEKKKNENSLEERIRQLTCDIDDEPDNKESGGKILAERASPQGEEASDEAKPLRPIESSSPSNSSSSSSTGSTYKKITDVFARHSFPPPIREDVNCNIKSDLVAAHEKELLPDNYSRFINPRATARISVTTETRKQFLSTLGPLTACVANADGREYSLDDIASVLQTDEPNIGVQPDVIAGTPQNETPGDELALFVQQDAGRIEKIKKRYSVDEKSDDEDDYGFNKRPQVKGIKPRFGTTQEIVQQIQQNQAVWPYYSQGGAYIGSAPHRPTFLSRSPSVYSSNSSLYQCQPIRTAGPAYNEIQNFHFRHPPQSPPPVRHRMPTPQPSPNPEGESRTLPRRTDGVVRNPDSVFFRRTVPNVHNPCVQMQFSPVGYTVPAASIRFSATCAPRPVIDESKVIIEPHYSTLPRPQVIRVGQGQQMIRVPVPYGAGTPVQVHLMARRCDSPQRPNSPQYLIAKGTQTAHHQPDGAPASIDFEAQGKAIAEELQQRQKLSRSLSQETGYQVPRPIQRATSPTCGRGVPEGAVSSSPDSYPSETAPALSNITGNTVYYSMNV